LGCRIESNIETIWFAQERCENQGKKETRFERSEKKTILVKEIITLLYIGKGAERLLF